MAKKKRHKSCLKCGRRISDIESQKRGYGPTCWKKSPSEIVRQLEEAGQLRLPGIA